MSSNWSHSQATLNLGYNWWFCCRCEFKIWRLTLENNRAHLLCYFKLCASFYSHLSIKMELQSHRWIQTRVTVRKPSIWVTIGDFVSHVSLKIDGWLWKTIGHLFYATSSFVHRFIATSEFKLELQSGNGYVRLWHRWPWLLTPDLDPLQGYHFCHW